MALTDEPLAERTTNWQNLQKEVRKQAAKEMKNDYLAGVPSTLIAEKYGVSRRTFYRLVNLTPKDKGQHARNRWIINKEIEGGDNDG